MRRPLLLASATLAAACAADLDDGPAHPDGAGGLPDAPDARRLPDAAGGPALAACSHFASLEEAHAFVNQERAGYEAHGRYRGIPWQGEDHEMRTFALTFSWSPDLAAAADAEARRLASGGEPAGVFVPGQNGENRDLWVDGLGTSSWRISTSELPGDWDVIGLFGHEKASLHPSNGSARMALYYHDFGGQGPAITRVGLGASATPSCEVFWVLQMGP
jgi:hypothetical protein